MSKVMWQHFQLVKMKMTCFAIKVYFQFFLSKVKDHLENKK